MIDVTIRLTRPEDAASHFAQLIQRMISRNIGPGQGNLNLVTAEEEAGANEGVPRWRLCANRHAIHLTQDVKQMGEIFVPIPQIRRQNVDLANRFGDQSRCRRRGSELSI